jgi:predicted RNase H-related nuclease YkuK (DUF458 family)
MGRVSCALNKPTVNWSCHVDRDSAFSLEKQDELECCQSNAVAKSVPRVPDLETKRVFLDKGANKNSNGQTYRQYQQARNYILGKGLLPNQVKSTE